MLDMSKHCPFCGDQTDEHSIYCLVCGKKLPERSEPVKGVPSWQDTLPPAQPSYQSQPAYGYTPTPRFQPKPYHPSMKAPCVERIFASLIDIGIMSFFTCFVYIGCIYPILKDGIRDGRSFGKGMLNLRVIDYQTGMPATIGQSCIRNCLCGFIDSCCCYLAMLVDPDGRRIADHVAGTVVIIDR